MSKQRDVVKNPMADMEYTTNSDNVKEGRKRRRKKSNKQKAGNKMVILKFNTSIITFNLSGLKI